MGLGVVFLYVSNPAQVPFASQQAPLKQCPLKATLLPYKTAASARPNMHVVTPGRLEGVAKSPLRTSSICCQATGFHASSAFPRPIAKQPQPTVLLWMMLAFWCLLSMASPVLVRHTSW